jgi:predicted AAA+ superfamily ATPase
MELGQLWDNFIVIERLKYRTYAQIPANIYFWRTYDQSEIDLVEERDGQLFGYECKWSDKKPIMAPRKWIEVYPKAKFQVIHPQNYQEFVIGDKT